MAKSAIQDGSEASTSPAEVVHAPAIHMSLQGKGGVGKSLVASILAQYFHFTGRQIECIDTDPVNRTFSQYKPSMQAGWNCYGTAISILAGSMR